MLSRWDSPLAFHNRCPCCWCQCSLLPEAQLLGLKLIGVLNYLMKYEMQILLCKSWPSAAFKRLIHPPYQLWRHRFVRCCVCKKVSIVAEIRRVGCFWLRSRLVQYLNIWTISFFNWAVCYSKEALDITAGSLLSKNPWNNVREYRAQCLSVILQC